MTKLCAAAVVVTLVLYDNESCIASYEAILSRYPHASIDICV